VLENSDGDLKKKKSRDESDGESYIDQGKKRRGVDSKIPKVSN